MNNLTIELDESNTKIIKRADEILGYKVSDLKKISVEFDDLIGYIEDLSEEVEHLREENADLENDRENNYTPVREDPYDEIGMSRNDF